MRIADASYDFHTSREKLDDFVTRPARGKSRIEANMVETQRSVLKGSPERKKESRTRESLALELPEMGILKESNEERVVEPYQEGEMSGSSKLGVTTRKWCARCANKSRDRVRRMPIVEPSKANLSHS